MEREVAIMMGSASDLAVVQKTMDVLDKLGIPWQARVVSAHRTPENDIVFAKTARDNGFKIVIAAAGMAAHLAGVMASHTTLPVIGIPCKGGALDGLDALLSTVQMPPGIPVATVALDGGANAGLLAAGILALSDEALAGRLAAYRDGLARMVEDSDAALQKKLQAK